MNNIHVTHDNNSSKGVGFTGLLQIVFIVLKLCGVIKWSWVWVLAPLWISFGLVLLICLLAVIIAVVKDE